MKKFWILFLTLTILPHALSILLHTQTMPQITWGLMYFYATEFENTLWKLITYGFIVDILYPTPFALSAVIGTTIHFMVHTYKSFIYLFKSTGSQTFAFSLLVIPLYLIEYLITSFYRYTLQPLDITTIAITVGSFPFVHSVLKRYKY